MSAAAAGGGSKGGGGGDSGREIDLTTLSIDQLNRLKQQLEQEVSMYATNLTTLRDAHGRYVDSKAALTALEPSDAGKAMLVPLTESMYVPGTLAESKDVLVDIGTGYFVRKSVDKAIAILTKKIAFVKGNLDKLGELMQAKRDDVNTVTSILNQKVKLAEAAAASGAR